jgi:hypothetical protein
MDDTEIVLYEPHPVRDLPKTLVASDLMSREVVSVPRDTPVRRVVELMLGMTYRSVPVVEAGAPVGIITNGDLVQRGGLGIGVDLLRNLEVIGRRSSAWNLAWAVHSTDPWPARALPPRSPLRSRAFQHRRSVFWRGTGTGASLSREHRDDSALLPPHARRSSGSRAGAR